MENHGKSIGKSKEHDLEMLGVFFHICVDLLDVAGENGFMLSIQQINGVFLLP